MAKSYEFVHFNIFCFCGFSGGTSLFSSNLIFRAVYLI